MPNPSKHRRERRRRIHSRIRLRIRGETGKPRLCVAFTGKHIYAQVIDDVAGKTLAAVASTQESHKGAKPNVAGAAKLGKALAETDAVEALAGLLGYFMTVAREPANSRLSFFIAATFAPCRNRLKQPCCACTWLYCFGVLPQYWAS